jgi:hypothetical protein
MRVIKYNFDIIQIHTVRLPGKERHEKENKDHSYELSIQ